MIRNLFVSMRGVIFDHVSAALRYLDYPHIEDLLKYYPKPGKDFREVFEISDWDWLRVHTAEEFWADIQPYPWINTIVPELRRFCRSIYLIDDYIGGEIGLTGYDRLWAKYLTDQIGVPIITPSKTALAAPGNVLLDANMDDIMRWQDNGGQSRVFPRPWNINHGCIVDPVTAVCSMLSRLAGRHQERDPGIEPMIGDTLTAVKKTTGRSYMRIVTQVTDTMVFYHTNDRKRRSRPISRQAWEAWAVDAVLVGENE